ncbi:nicotinamide phosphoribosyltransferase [Spiroplasma corruscae]|uniref:Nicotinamide phosphoribosyltransferase n=1 Tax=Spiroplasma corruscae TaxID=216934 RepID=A0A222ENU6_9MOLU|nr:nicotinamide phosphoribosyltransferase domain-containing protein [Spiroplasma corruscae]ASP28167.1 nicotinamide phosphoribosyltransferase [Spiroplasma corruscae]
MISLFKTDSYKLDHKDQYPDKTTFLFANITPRSFKKFDEEYNFSNDKIDYIYSYGVEYTFKKLFEDWDYNFFRLTWEEIINEIEEMKSYTNIKFTSGMIDDFKYLHEELKSLPIDFLTLEHHEKEIESKIKIKENTPIALLWNTHPRFYWLVSYIETWLISEIWPIITSGNVSYQFRKLAQKYSHITCDDDSHIDYQFHDFSQRGICTNYGAIKTGIGHLMNFVGSDNLPSIKELYKYKDYFGNFSRKILGTSVYATEHSVMSAGLKEKEFITYERLIDLYPNGVLSVVSDTWNIFNVLEVYLPKLKNKIIARNGKFVIRPDSLDPLELIAGKKQINLNEELFESEKLGIIKYIDTIFGHKINSKGYKILNEKIGVILGDNINYKKALCIFKELEKMGYASSNVVFGIGAYNYSWSIRRDSLSMAQKVTFAKIDNKNLMIQKAPYKENNKKSRLGLIKFNFINENNEWSVTINDGLSLYEWKDSLSEEKLIKIKWLF